MHHTAMQSYWPDDHFYLTSQRHDDADKTEVSKLNALNAVKALPSGLIDTLQLELRYRLSSRWGDADPAREWNDQDARFWRRKVDHVGNDPNARSTWISLLVPGKPRQAIEDAGFRTMSVSDEVCTLLMWQSHWPDLVEVARSAREEAGILNMDTQICWMIDQFAKPKNEIHVSE